MYCDTLDNKRSIILLCSKLCIYVNYKCKCVLVKTYLIPRSRGLIHPGEGQRASSLAVEGCQQLATVTLFI